MKSKPFSEHGADGGCPNNQSDQGLTPRCGPNSTIDAQTEIGALPAPRTSVPALPRVGWVYFITDNEAIKIGYSVSVEHRRADLQGSHHKPLRIITKFPGTRTDERALHDKFRHIRLQGEWFRKDTGEIEAFLPELEQYRNRINGRYITIRHALRGEVEKVWESLMGRPRKPQRDISAAVALFDVLKPLIETPEALKLAGIITVAFEQWPNKAGEPQEKEQSFLLRDIDALTACLGR